MIFQLLFLLHCALFTSPSQPKSIRESITLKSAAYTIKIRHSEMESYYSVNLDMVCPFFWLNQPFYNEEQYYSTSIISTTEIELSNTMVSAQYIRSSFTFVDSKTEMQNLHFYIVPSPPSNAYQSFHLAKYPKEKSITYLLYNQGSIDYPSCSFIKDNNRNHIYIDFGTSTILSKHKATCKSYPNKWGCNLNKVTYIDKELNMNMVYDNSINKYETVFQILYTFLMIL